MTVRIQLKGRVYTSDLRGCKALGAAETWAPRPLHACLDGLHGPRVGTMAAILPGRCAVQPSSSGTVTPSTSPWSEVGMRICSCFGLAAGLVLAALSSPLIAKA